jgi:hypothetical protein
MRSAGGSMATAGESLEKTHGPLDIRDADAEPNHAQCAEKITAMSNRY